MRRASTGYIPDDQGIGVFANVSLHSTSYKSTNIEEINKRNF